MLGGYKLIDLKGINLATGVPSEAVPGLYENIESNIHKPLLFDNIVIDGVEKPAQFVTGECVGSSFKGYIGFNRAIEIKDSGVITVTTLGAGA